MTTQRLTTRANGIESSGDLDRATDKLYGHFKGYKAETFTFGLVQMGNGDELKYFIETGKASMVMIYGVRTVIRLQQMTNKQVENVTRIWNKKSTS